MFIGVLTLVTVSNFSDGPFGVGTAYDRRIVDASYGNKGGSNIRITIRVFYFIVKTIDRRIIRAQILIGRGRVVIEAAIGIKCQIAGGSVNEAYCAQVIRNVIFTIAVVSQNIA